MERVLIAVGGNALYETGSDSNVSPERLKEVCRQVLGVLDQGYLPVVTFGNGPQVGNLLDIAETAARGLKTPVTLDICVSWTQGEIAYALSKELNNQLKASGHPYSVVGVNTTVKVDSKDPAFDKPTKPVGKFISPEDAKKMYEERGWVIGPDSNRGYRRMVPSPKPLEILEASAIGAMMTQDIIPLCCGGGGIPVSGEMGALEGIEAVIDKDYTSCLLAKTLKIPNLIISTTVDHVYLNFGTPDQRPLEQVSLAEAEKYLEEGHFSDGSMKPKIEALVDYLKNGGKKAIITSLPNIIHALERKAGTQIIC